MSKQPTSRASKKTPSRAGATLAALRQAAGLSQVQLAAAVGIPQRTISFYETEAGDIPSSLIPALARALDVPIETVLGIEPAESKKRGPKSQLERRMEALARLPRADQQRILNVVEALITQARASR